MSCRFHQSPKLLLEGYANIERTGRTDAVHAETLFFTFAFADTHWMQRRNIFSATGACWLFAGMFIVISIEKKIAAYAGESQP
jgi:hypothetical protein